MKLPPLVPLFALLSTGALAADWPQWRGPARTGHVPAGEAIPTAIPAEPKVLWQLPIGDGFASPVVAHGRVFYLDQANEMEIAHAADAATGKELWQASIFSAHRDGFGIGPRCTPVADGERVFFQSAKGELQCLGASDGKVIWRKNFVDDFGAIYIGEKGKAAGASRHGAAGSPIIDGDHLIVQVGGANGASIVAFQKATGEVVWKSQNDQTAYAAPILAEVAGVRQFISFTAEALIGLDPSDGKLLWRRPLQTALGRHVTTPVVVGDLVIVASHTLGMVATRIAASDAGLVATEAWVNKKAAMNFTSPVVVDGFLYGIGPAKNLVCVDAKTGEIAWEKTGLIQSSGDKAEAGFLVLGQNIGMLTDSGAFVLFAADARGYQESGQAQLCGSTWCNPAYADGRLFLRDQRELRCVELVAPGAAENRSPLIFFRMPLAAFPKCFLDDLVVRKSMSVEQWIELVAAELDVDGLEFYWGFTPAENEGELARLRALADAHGLAIPMMCYSPDFTQPDAAARARESRAGAARDRGHGAARREILSCPQRTTATRRFDRRRGENGGGMHRGVPAKSEGMRRHAHPRESLQRRLLAVPGVCAEDAKFFSNCSTRSRTARGSV